MRARARPGGALLPPECERRRRRRHERGGKGENEREGDGRERRKECLEEGGGVHPCQNARPNVFRRWRLFHAQNEVEEVNSDANLVLV